MINTATVAHCHGTILLRRMKSRTSVFIISLLFGVASAHKNNFEPMSAGRIAFAPEALVFDFDREVPTRLMHNQPATRTEAIDKPKQEQEEEESSSLSSDKLQEKEPDFFEAMDGSTGLRYSITSSETNNNNNLWSCEALRQNEASVDMNDKRPLYEATNENGYDADNEQEDDEDDNDEDDEEWGEDEEDDFYDNEDRDGEIFPCTQSLEELTELEISTNQNTLLNSLPALPHLKTKTVRSKRGRRQQQKLKKRSSRQEHQDLRRRQRQQTRDLLLLKGGGGAGAVHARYSQNGRVTPSILNTVDSITLYKANLGKKPKQPERHRHSERQRNPDASDNDDSGRRSGSSRNPNGSAQPAQPAPSDPRNERTTQQRVIEEPPIEVVGHVPRKPLFFPGK